MFINYNFLTTRSKMNRNFSLLLLVLVLGLTLVLGERDPCRSKKRDKKLRKEKCYKRGGYCFERKCEGCQTGTIVTGLCGSKKLLCCLRDKPTEKPTPIEEKCCRISSDPHILTYDGYSYDVQIPGDFLASKPCNSADWEVIATFDYPYAGASWTDTVNITINIPGVQVIVKDDGTVRINGVLTALPYFDPDFHIYQIGNEIKIYLLNLGVAISYDLHQYETLRVCVIEKWFDELCGLCGNGNDDRKDDKYNVPPNNVKIGCPFPKRHSSWKYCKKILTRILRKCPEVSIKSYLNFCAYDYCAEGKDGAEHTFAAARKHCASVGQSIIGNEEENLNEAMEKS